MKKRKYIGEATTKSFANLKKKLFSAFTMFLVATLLMGSVSYAWFVLSVAPEVSGITTNIGANGSLEIALLTTETKTDLSAIKTTVGESLSRRNSSANNTWGNLIDLSYAEYGLGDIVLMPARLNIVQGTERDAVDTSLLLVPTYGYDGRIVELSDDAMSATYQNREFSLVVGNQDYGVRAIGTTDALNAQASALALAKANIVSFTNSAKSATTATLNTYGDSLMNIVLAHAMDSAATYDDADLEQLKAMISEMDGAADYIDKAMRQGLVAVAASEIGSIDVFTEVRDRVMDASKTLDVIVDELTEVTALPAEFTAWVDAYMEMQNNINAAKNAADALSGNSYTWAQFRVVLDFVMNVNNTYINETPFAEFSRDDAESLLGGNVTLTLAPGSGVFADIADFIGNYTTMMTAMGTSIEVKTVSPVNPAYMSALSAAVKSLEAASGGEGSTADAVDLNNTYGYAIDLAFRCNAGVSDLLLQTTPEHRVYAGEESGSAMGGGSYMEFRASDDTITADKMLLLMDAVRVAFVDDKNELLGIAKLNTSNRSADGDGMKAPLYLYDYAISEEDGSLVMGERRKTENALMPLEQNVAKSITAIVWLDGDIVDNTMVSATEDMTLSGVLNLQFASSAELIPADNQELRNISADKTELGGALEGYTKQDGLIAAGQGTYTTVSWEAFVEAYEYAAAVNQNPNATETQVYFAALELAKAEAALETASADAVSAKISEVRDLMGTTQNVARYVIKTENGNFIAVGSEAHTEEEHNEWNIVGQVYQVDYQNNLHDEGNGILTQIYTDESWRALAVALYNAETAVMNVNAAGEAMLVQVDETADGGTASGDETNEKEEVKTRPLTEAEIDAVLTELEEAHEALQRQVFYAPYEYNGTIYYEAICDAANADTYGKWYDSQFKRVVADLTILNLDAYAEATEVFEIVQEPYVERDTVSVTPFIRILDDVYPELRSDAIKGASWSVFDATYLGKEVAPEEETPEEEPEQGDPVHDCVPVISEIFEVIYENESAGVKLNLTGTEGTTELSAVVLSENGVVCKISKVVEIYIAAYDAEITNASVNVTEGSTDVIDVNLTGAHTERIRTVTWASENTEVATVSGSGITCTINAVKAGSTRITVSVETVQGNVYTAAATVTVSAAPEATP